MYSKIIKEFIESIDDIYAVQIDLNLAFLLYSDKIKDETKNAPEGARMFFGDGKPNDDIKPKLSMPITDLIERIKPNGKDAQILNNLCLISIYQLWEDNYRGKIATELGKSKNDFKLDIFGDIRLIRQAIIHHIHNKKEHLKNLKILTYLKEREYIYFTRSEFDEIVKTIKNVLLKMDDTLN